MMTDRTGRDGDTVATLGGALRFVGGARVGLTKNHDSAFYGPVSLPLGVHVTHIPEDDAWCGCGVHLQVDVLDLGEYVSFNDQANVAKPNLADALAPSFTLGMAFGKSVPFVLGVTAGYSPRVVLAPESSPNDKGALNLGVTAGMEVPLFDMN